MEDHTNMVYLQITLTNFNNINRILATTNRNRKLSSVVNTTHK